MESGWPRIERGDLELRVIGAVHRCWYAMELEVSVSVCEKIVDGKEEKSGSESTTYSGLPSAGAPRIHLKREHLPNYCVSGWSNTKTNYGGR